MISKFRASANTVSRMRGFTLLELMIVVVIIAILAALAIPAYGRYAYRARRPDGQELLLRIANAEERYYATNNKFGSLADINYASATSEKGYYAATITLAADPAGNANQAFTAKATAPAGGPQANDACGQLSIDNTGTKLPAATDTAHNSNGSCW
jgi:type IV pilus assembly protein PilE